MDRKIALKWARALESGKYQQTSGALRDNNGLCCLGVLCNLHAQAHPAIAAEQLDPEEYMGKQASLPEAVMEWAGISHADGTFAGGRITFKDPADSLGPSGFSGYDYGDSGYFDREQPEVHEACNLVELNDDYEMDFDFIAKIIRKHSDKL